MIYTKTSRFKQCLICVNTFFDSSKWNQKKYCSYKCSSVGTQIRRYKLDFSKVSRIWSRNNNCMICEKPYKTDRDKNIDHCHDTGNFRGILCNNCNTGLGRLGDNVKGLQKALDYLKE